MAKNSYISQAIETLRKIRNSKGREALTPKVVAKRKRDFREALERKKSREVEEELAPTPQAPTPAPAPQQNTQLGVVQPQLGVEQPGVLPNV